MSEPLYCGAIEPRRAYLSARDPFLCTEPSGHSGRHIATVGDAVVNSWKRTPDDEFYGELAHEETP